MNIKRIVVMVLALVLFGCKTKSVNYTYLMQHPKELLALQVDCQLNNSAQCQIVHQAAQDYAALSSEHEKDPEAFGEKILKAQQELAQLQAKPSSEQVYQAQLDKVNALLAIVALTRPE